MVDHAEQRFGGVDILLNNAAVLVLAAVEITTLAEYERVVRVNQVGPFLGIRAVVPSMKRRGGARSSTSVRPMACFPGIRA